MKALKNKIQKLSPLIQRRNSVVEKELRLLLTMKNKQTELQKNLEVVQKKYLAGVDHLNPLRNQGHFQLLDGLEFALTATKVEWGTSLSYLRESEAQVLRQNQKVLDAQKKLQSLEKLQERYRFEWQKSQEEQERKAMDEIALQRHYQNKKDSLNE